MGDAIEQRRRHLGVAEHAHPFGEGQVGGDDQRGLLVKLADQMEQQGTAGGGEWQIAEFIKDDSIGLDQLLGQVPAVLNANESRSRVASWAGGGSQVTGRDSLGESTKQQFVDFRILTLN